MTPAPSLARITAVASSLTLLAAYVWHSQTTPNVPPPDPLGIHQSDASKPLDELLETGTPMPARPFSPDRRSDLRIIGSKNINQPIFSIRRAPPGPHSLEFIFSGSQKDSTMPEMPSFIKTSGLPTFDLFGENQPARPAR